MYVLYKYQKMDAAKDGGCSVYRQLTATCTWFASLQCKTKPEGTVGQSYCLKLNNRLTESVATSPHWPHRCDLLRGANSVSLGNMSHHGMVVKSHLIWSFSTDKSWWGPTIRCMEGRPGWLNERFVVPKSYSLKLLVANGYRKVQTW